MENSTTVQVSKQTKEKLEELKHRSSETYDEIITDLIELAEEDHLELSEGSKKKLSTGHKDIKKGRVHSTKELIKELGI